MQNQLLVPRKILFFSLGLMAVFVLSGCENRIVSKIVSGDSKNNIKVDTKVQAGQVAVLESDIIVTKPLSNEEIDNSLRVTGRARTDAPITINLLDANNNVVASATSQNGLGINGWGVFEKTLVFENVTTPTGWLEVSSSADSVGSISLPIRFKNYQSLGVRVFFGNNIQDPEGLNCSQVYSVTRSVTSADQAVATALNALLNGPTSEEVEQGFFSSLPSPDSGIQINNVNSNEGVVTIDFNEGLDEGVAGSCRVSAIRAQIIQTVSQFDGVESVVITINGESEDVLQP